MGSTAALLMQVRACTRCAEHLPHGPRPVLQLHRSAALLIAAQAPGRKVHDSGVPFDDASGERLRAWLGLSHDVFYDPRRVAIVPMGLCYPGRGVGGDRPPRPECAPAWRAPLLAHLTRLRLTLVIGRHALAWHLPDARSLTQAVHDCDVRAAALVPLPHPSPRNNLWLARHPWFERERLVPLRERVREALGG
jgi:uracil-DNA glycosylase